MNDRQDRGMAAVLSWLQNDGSSSAMGRPESAGPAFDAMSFDSLQVSPIAHYAPLTVCGGCDAWLASTVSFTGQLTCCWIDSGAGY